MRYEPLVGGIVTEHGQWFCKMVIAAFIRKKQLAAATHE
jgi:hypothetical protein